MNALLVFTAYAQPSYTANDQVKAYDEPFLYGSNMGYFSGWTDEQLAEILAGKPSEGIDGVGVHTLRPTLPEDFLEQWGYNIRVDAFNYYMSLGIKENTVFLEGPSEAHRSTENHCAQAQSKLFKNLYEPIWDGGLNGTPYNDQNYFASYVYKTVSQYKGKVRFWEIWNEPDFTNSSFGWQGPEVGDSWWNKDPAPCDLPNTYAPIQYYIRQLRIAYEVIKTVDEDSYIAVGGLGYASFLDAILRNTDNPDGGKVTNAYPQKGGAYFDVMSFHAYPQFEQSVKLKRNSDQAVQGTLDIMQRFQDVLENRGYDGNTYPKKVWLLTETNIPRKAFGDDIGGLEVQKNYLMKMMVKAQEAGIAQVYSYSLADVGDYASAVSGFQLMGLYENISNKGPSQIQATGGGMANRSLWMVLEGARFQQERTFTLALPNGVEGLTFLTKDGHYAYVLWAKTQQDRSESASGSYTFPASMNVGQLDLYRWDFSQNLSVEKTSGTDIPLSGSPIILVENEIQSLSLETKEQIKVYAVPNPSAQRTEVNFTLTTSDYCSLQIRDAQGNLVREVLEDEFMNQGHHKLSVDISDLTKGVYLIRLVTGEKMVVSYLVVQ